MNDLNLRISGGIGEKVKKPMAPITMVNWNTEHPGSANKFTKEFLNSRSADEQLKLLKQYLNKNKEFLDEEIVEFLVILFWEADAKHPVKGFLKKHITESRTLEEPFTKRLIEIIKAEIKKTPDMPYGSYISVMTHLDTCIDKFPPGAKAVSSLELDVAMYLIDCLESCVATLSKEEECGDSKTPLAPTEINKIYDLAHLTLRLLLYMIQKVTDGNRDQLRSMFGRIRSVTTVLMQGKEVPMDTKSVSGIVALNMHLFENGPDSWIELLDKEAGAESGTVELCMYSAVATAVPRAALLAERAGRPALLLLADRVLDIGDRYSSCASHALGVARTALALGKCLARAAPAQRGPLALRLAAHCWPRLDHRMDSVRHLAAQTLAHVVDACVRIDNEGEPSALDGLFAALEALGETRGAWAARAQLAARLGPCLLRRAPALLPAAAAAAARPALQASAALFLGTLLERYTREASPETVYEEFVRVVLEAARAETEPSALGVLQDVLARAVRWDRAVLDCILPEMDQLHTYEGSDLKCILLVLGVVRKSDAAYKDGILRQLHATAYDADDEIRILALALVSSCPSSTAALQPEELQYVLDWARYNLNAQAPGFRQLMMAHMKKILKRLESSLDISEKSQRSLSPEERAAAARFAGALRGLCFASLAPGANYGRRACALQLLAWLPRITALLDIKPWSEELAEVVYNVLEDTYEANKALALEILKDCPSEYISKIEGPGDECFERLLQQAERVKPTECVSASYKMQLLFGRPNSVTLDEDTEGYPERARFCALARLLRRLRAQAEARGAALFGLLHCVNRLFNCVDADAIAGHPGWSRLAGGALAACAQVNARADPVVSAASPEGLLPEELGDACLDDGRPVTAQMAVMCAWRSVKETSLLLGALVSRLRLQGEAPAWTLSAAQARGAGEALGALLSRARHRGAFEQAYVGLATLLARLWKCKSPELHQLPLQWFADIERDFLLPAPPEGASEYCATRRGAGLPFMIQALVTTELAAEPTVPRGRLLARAAALCLARARGPAAAARAHLVLRALFRHAEPGAGAAARALRLAIKGFDADDWMVRNSSTLLFAALTVRVFGVPRARAGRLRERMTGRIFFLRYPDLYDFLLERLQSACLEQLQPSLFPALLLLGRLYPSALEGTVSNLKLERFGPLVAALAGARDAAARRLAARALPPLLPPHKYGPYIQSLFETLSNPHIKMNLCHGLLCQLSVLLEAGAGGPAGAVGGPAGAAGGPAGAVGGGAWLAGALGGTRWLVTSPCFLAADEYLAVLQLLLLRFPEPGLLDEELAITGEHLSRALFAHTRPRVTGGREVFLANAALMYLLILTACKRDVFKTTMQCLAHPDYEVQLSALNYLLTLHGQCDDSNAFLDHLSSITSGDTVIGIQKEPDYLKTLAAASKSLYAECSQKALKLITLAPGCPATQLLLVQLKLGTAETFTHERIVAELLDSAVNAHENLQHVYLESVVQLVSQCECDTETMLSVLRTLHEYCSAANDERSRAAVVTFLEFNYAKILSSGAEGSQRDGAAWLAVVVPAAATAAILLEDDDPELRARASAAVYDAHSTVPHGMESVQQAAGAPRARRVLAAAAAQRLREDRRFAAAPALQLVLAGLDFGAAARAGLRLGDELRVFDQNEMQNVYLEEFTWTVECARMIKTYYELEDRTVTIDDFVASLANDHKQIIEQLCIEDAMPCFTERKKSFNPKMDLFWKTLYE